MRCPSSAGLSTVRPAPMPTYVHVPAHMHAPAQLQSLSPHDTCTCTLTCACTCTSTYARNTCSYLCTAPIPLPARWLHGFYLSLLSRRYLSLLPLPAISLLSRCYLAAISLLSRCYLAAISDGGRRSMVAGSPLSLRAEASCPGWRWRPSSRAWPTSPLYSARTAHPRPSCAGRPRRSAARTCWRVRV